MKKEDIFVIGGVGIACLCITNLIDTLVIAKKVDEIEALSDKNTMIRNKNTISVTNSINDLNYRVKKLRKELDELKEVKDGNNS